MTATRRKPGTISRSSSSLLTFISADINVMPVMLLCGRDRLSAKPAVTGSPLVTYTIAQVSQPSEERRYEVWDAHRCEIREPNGPRGGLGRRRFISGGERGKP